MTSGLSFNDIYSKAQTISGDTTTATLAELKQDINVGYARFNAATSRYFTRKQKFASIVASQQYYQVPVDTIRVTEATIAVNSNYTITLEQVHSEHEWRRINSFTSYTSNWPSHFWVNGDMQIGIYPTPSTAITNGLRYVYQPQDVYLTKADYTTGTVAITAAATSVTGTSSVWTSATHKGMFLQVTDGSDGNWYEVDTVSGNTTLTLVTPYAGPTVSTAAYKLGQMMMIPGEYSDIPLDYAMMRFFESRNNPERAKYHQRNFMDAIKDASAKYASSSTSRVLTDEINVGNAWQITPTAG